MSRSEEFSDTVSSERVHSCEQALNCHARRPDAVTSQNATWFVTSHVALHETCLPGKVQKGRPNTKTKAPLEGQQICMLQITAKSKTSIPRKKKSVCFVVLLQNALIQTEPTFDIVFFCMCALCVRLFVYTGPRTRATDCSPGYFRASSLLRSSF